MIQTLRVFLFEYLSRPALLLSFNFIKTVIFAVVGASVDVQSTQNIYELFFLKPFLIACSLLSPFTGLRENFRYPRMRVSSNILSLSMFQNLKALGQSETWLKKVKISQRACVFEHNVVDKIWAGDLYGRLQWRADRQAIVNSYTGRTRIFHPACEMKTLNWMQSIVMRFGYWTYMSKYHADRTRIFLPTYEKKAINWMQSIVLWNKRMNKKVQLETSEGKGLESTKVEDLFSHSSTCLPTVWTSGSVISFVKLRSKLGNAILLRGCTHLFAALIAFGKCAKGKGA